MGGIGAGYPNFLWSGHAHCLVLGALVMMPLLLGMNLIQQWEIVFIQLGYVAIYAYLLIDLEWNRWSVDSLFQSRNANGRKL